MNVWMCHGAVMVESWMGSSKGACTRVRAVEGVARAASRYCQWGGPERGSNVSDGSGAHPSTILKLVARAVAKGRGEGGCTGVP